MAIHTANETTYLQALASDFPSIIFWNADRFTVHDEHINAFEALIDADILHHSPEAAAKKLNQIYQDPQTWWKSKRVQKARTYFCDKLAYTSEDYLDTWKVKLNSLINSNQGG